MFDALKFRMFSAVVTCTLAFGLALPATAQDGAPDELAPDALGSDEPSETADEGATVDPDDRGSDETPASDADPAEDPAGAEKGDEGGVGDEPPADTGADADEPAGTDEGADKKAGEDGDRFEGPGEPLPEPELGAAAVGGAFAAGFAATAAYGAISTAFGLFSTIIGFAVPASALISPPWSSIVLAMSLLSCTNFVGACLTMPAVVGGGVTAAGNALSDYESNYLYTILASYLGCWGLGLVNVVIGLAVSLVAAAIFPPTTQGGVLASNPIASAVGLGVGVVSGGILIGLGVPAIAAGTWYAAASPKEEFLPAEEEDDVGEYEYEDEEGGEYEDEYEDEGDYDDDDRGYDDDEGYEDDYDDDYDDASNRTAFTSSPSVPAQAY